MVINLPDLKTQRAFIVKNKLANFRPIPDSSLHYPDVHYMRALVEACGLSQRKAADVLGISERSMRHYLDPNHDSRAPYAIQFALECLAVENTR